MADADRGDDVSVSRACLVFKLNAGMPAGILGCPGDAFHHVMHPGLWAVALLEAAEANSTHITVSYCYVSVYIYLSAYLSTHIQYASL